MNPEFTIVTPSLNYGRFIGDCLESVRAEAAAGVSVEHLVIDGGSDDDTAAVVAGYPHAQWRQGPDEGMSDAINKGFQLARGRWVMWLNADDRLVPGALARVREFILDHGQAADVVYGDWNFINEGGHPIRRMRVFPFQKRMLAHLGCYIASTACFLKRETTLEAGHFLNVDFRYVMDGEYYNRLAAAGLKFEYLPAVLAEFRWHANNLSVRNHAGRGINEALRLERQYAESRAIRRVYGWTCFRGEHLNAVVDALLFHWFLLEKGLRKRLRARPRNEARQHEIKQK